MALREWLLKDEKAKVGRPKLANEILVKKSVLMIVFCLMLCTIMGFTYVSILKGTTPFKLIGSIASSKLDGIIENKDGFLINSYYNDKGNYVLKIKASDAVKRYSGNYKYTTYYLKNNSWIEKEIKEVEKGKDSFKIEFDSLNNQNRTWKIKLQIVNSSKIKESYAPYSWKFVDSSKEEEKYAYNIFTVKGFYSPVSKEETKESKKNKDKISVSTTKENPRQLILNALDYNYDASVTYTDASGKKTPVSNKKDLKGITTYNIPNFNYAVNVTIKVWVNGLSKAELEGKKLSNWQLKQDKKKNNYITMTYVLKPEASYKY